MSELMEAIRAGDRGALAAMVADDVVFHSPTTTYEGRDQVVQLLALIGTVYEGMTSTREVETVTFVKGHVGDEDLNGVLVEIKDDEGRITEITLLLRPLAALQTAVRQMARALAEGE